MRVRFSVGELANILSETVGFKSGLALTRSALFELVAGESAYANQLDLPAYETIVMRGEEFDEIYYLVLYKLGVTDSPTPTSPLDFNLFTRYKDKPKELETFLGVQRIYAEVAREEIHKVELTGEGSLDPTEFIKRSANKFGSLGLEMAMETIQGVNHHLNLHPFSSLRRVEWKEIRDLEDLFLSENIRAEQGKFFDQRFIDFLNRNFEQIDNINWRQFEALTAEFFDRLGYDVELGPGRDDEGIDARVWDKGISTGGPPLIVIQCKRQKAKVEKVVVKALWADLSAEQANSGLIVTTSALSPGSVKTCRARGYPIEQANRNNLRKWLDQLRTPWFGAFMDE